MRHPHPPRTARRRRLARIATIAANALAATAHAQHERHGDEGLYVRLAGLPDAISESGAAALRGQVYSVGAFRTDTSALPWVFRYDPPTDTWEQLADLPTTRGGLHHVAVVALGDHLYALGGLDTLFRASGECFRYDPATDTWTPIAPLPLPRGAAAACVLNGKIYVMGGAPRARLRDFAAYDPATDTWEQLPPMPTGREHLAAVAMNGKVIALGGRVGFGEAGTLYDRVEAYDPQTRTWSHMPPMPNARSGFAAAHVAGRIFVCGGEWDFTAPNGLIEEAELYHAGSGTWRPVEAMDAPRHGFGAAMIDGLVYLPGGGRQVAGAQSRYFDAYVVPLMADMNDDRVVDNADIALFIEAFLNGDSLADFTADGVFDLGDIQAYIHRYLEG